MQARTMLDQIELHVSSGTVFVQMRKQVVADDGKTIIADELHRTSFAPASAQEHMAAIGSTLKDMGYGGVEKGDIDLIASLAALLPPARAEPHPSGLLPSKRDEGLAMSQGR